MTSDSEWLINRLFNFDWMVINYDDQLNEQHLSFSLSKTTSPNKSRTKCIIWHTESVRDRIHLILGVLSRLQSIDDYRQRVLQLGAILLMRWRSGTWHRCGLVSIRHCYHFHLIFYWVKSIVRVRNAIMRCSKAINNAREIAWIVCIPPTL